ncbi:MAG: hypothetical protein JNL63_10350 [Bacteroidia bacterium]|nr:hypothetical protein [Bacteroidia bacterium]
MKNKYCFAFIASFIICNLFADNTNTDPQIKARASEWMSQQTPFGFIENKGQMADINGEPAPYVLFKAELPNLDIWVTTTGLTYQFYKLEKEENLASHLTGNVITSESEALTKVWHRVDMLVKGASIRKENVITEGDITVGKVDYYLSHCPDGVLNVKTYSKVIIKEVYPGIDWVLYTSPLTNQQKSTLPLGGGGGGLKHDFIVHPNADPDQIKLIYEGSGKLKVKSDQIHFKNELGELTEGKLLCYQENNLHPVFSEYIVKETGKEIKDGFSYEVGIKINAYEKDKILTIDPQLWWGTIYGGPANDGMNGVCTDPAGNIFIAGYSQTGGGFPTQNPGGGAWFQGAMPGGIDACILKFSPNGVRLWSTYYGGNNSGEQLYDVAYNGGSIYLVGTTRSTNLPVLALAGAYNQAVNGGGDDFFILKFNSTTCVRLWATYYGGGGWDSGNSLYVDAAGNLFIIGGGTNATPLVNPGGGAYFNNTISGSGLFWTGIVAMFNTAGVLTWATEFPGTLNPTIGPGAGDARVVDITGDNAGNIFIVANSSNLIPPLVNAGTYFQGANAGNTDLVIAKFNSAKALVWCTYYGGSDVDEPNAITTDAGGNIIITGQTKSPNFPAFDPGGGAYYQATHGSVGSWNAFILKFSNIGTRIWSTYFGTAYSSGIEVTTDQCNNIYVTGIQVQGNMVTQASNCSYIGTTTTPVGSDCFIAQFSNTNYSLIWSQIFGAPASDTHSGAGSWPTNIAVDVNGNIVCVGEDHSPGFTALQNPGGGAYYDASGAISDDESFIVKFIPPTVTLSTAIANNTSGCTCNGSVAATVNCGISLYNYTWSNGNKTLNSTSGTNVISGLCPGTYTVTVSTGCNLALTASATIIGPAGGVSASISSVNVTCNGGNTGSASVTTLGGTPPYTYSWSAPVGQTAATVTGLAAGSYTVTITDASGCNSIQLVSVTQPPAITLGFTAQWSCSANMGIATVSTANGRSPYNYLWNNGQNTSSITGLNPGTYSVTVTDADGCARTGTLPVIIVSDPMTLSTTSQNINCNLSGSGSVNVSGGTPAYKYSWSDGQVLPSVSGLIAGVYTVTVTDALGCTKTATITIGGSAPGVSATFSQSPTGTVCVGTTVNFTNTGTAAGTGITHNWLVSGNTTSAVAVNYSYTFLVAGTYSVTHYVYSSALNCANTIAGVVKVIDCSAGPTVTAMSSSICPGSCATVTASGAGGTSPYTYSWSNSATTQNINPCPVATTTYTVTIRDGGGNTSTSTAVVTINPAITVTTTATNTTCSGASTGSATAVGGGGSLPYTYNWSAGVPGSGFQVSGLSAGSYTVTIIDSKGCTATATTIINSPPALAGQFAKGTANCGGCGCKQWIMVSATGGTSPYTYSWPDGYVNRYKNQLCPGAYGINIIDKNGCSINVNLTAP